MDRIQGGHFGTLLADGQSDSDDDIINQNDGRPPSPPPEVLPKGFSRLKLEIPCVYEDAPEYGMQWFQQIRDAQKQLLQKALAEFNIDYDEGHEEHADEGDSVGEMKFCTLAYKIFHSEFNRSLLRTTRKFFEDIQDDQFPPIMSPLVILPSADCFDPQLVSCHNSVSCSAFMWGNIQGGSYFNHWEVSMDHPRMSHRSNDRLFTDFEYDRIDMIVSTFSCQLRSKEDRTFKKAQYKIIVARSLIRRIIVDNSVKDQFGDGRTRIHFELNNPPNISRAWANNRNPDQKAKFHRETTIKHGRIEGKYPKDAELSNCPYYSIEFSTKVDNSKIYSILSRLRARTGLAIEFGTFPVIDSLIINDKPYFSWIPREMRRQGTGQQEWINHPTSDKDGMFKQFLDFCVPTNARLPGEERQLVRAKRFSITYLVECLLSRGAIVKDQLCIQHDHWLRFLQILAEKFRDNFDRAERTLERLVTMIDERKRIGSIHNLLRKLYEVIRQEDSNPAAPLPEETREGYQRVRKVILTPTRKIYVVPEMMMSNRVLRKYDPFGINVLRVAFRDDNGQKMRSTTTGEATIDRAVKKTLVDGMVIGGLVFGYLGSSNSQLRDHGAYFMQKMTYQDLKDWRRENPDKRNPGYDVMWQIDFVRKSLGKFEKIESIPKLMARLGQCFTQSRESGVSLPLENCMEIHDIVGGSNTQGVEFTFTDGVGCISREFAKRLATDFGIAKGHPSCFQFRYRGMKGVLGVNLYIDEHNGWVKRRERGTPPAHLKDWTIHVALRDSQDKFYGARQEFIEIVKVSTPSPVSLNKPFINILDQVSELQGVECHRRMTERIEQLLDRQMRGFATQMIDETTCRNRLKELPRRIDIDKLSTTAGFEMSNEPFFRSLIKASVKFSVTKQLRKAQIQIPFEYGRTLLGIADETGRLQYGQVFVQVTKSIRDKFPNPNAAKRVLEGKVLLTKNPCIVAGDVRVFEAVDIPDLHHLTDVIVFPVHGPRPHPDEMAGSDLDGDEYVVIWDQQLLLERNEAPFDFSVPKRVDDDVKRNQQEKMADFYVKYMTQDNVGSIANAFLNASDMYGINHTVCMQLAMKNSQAVDFTKSGMPPAPLTKNWTEDPVTGEEIPPEKSDRNPDFQAGDSNRPVYQSPRLLGKLLREIKGIEDVMKVAEDKDEAIPIELDKFIHVDGWEEYKDIALEELSKYNTLLRTAMETYGIRSEAEIFSGCICDIRNRLSDKDQDDMSFFNTNQVIETRITNMFRRFREAFFNDEFGGWQAATTKVDRLFADENNVCHREVVMPTDAMKKKAFAYYKVCYERARESGERKLSFAWLAYDILANIKQEKIRESDTDFSITGNPLFQLLEDRLSKYIAERQVKFEKFCRFVPRLGLHTAVEPLIKYCTKYRGLDRLLFIIHEWGNNLRLYTSRFSSTHLSLLVIMYFTNAFSSLDGDALQLLQPIPLNARADELEPEDFGRHSELVLKFFEFLASRKFGRLSHICYSFLGVQSFFSRGEWVRYHRAAVTTYYNMVYNLRFEELPLRGEEEAVKNEVIREVEPFAMELSEELPVEDSLIAAKLQDKTGVVDIQLRRQPRNKILVSARGTLESLDALRRLVTVMPNKHTSSSGKRVQEQLFELVYEKIMKDEVTDLDLVHYDSEGEEDS